MASWKKIIVSGSDAELNALSLSGLSNQGSEATAVMINGSGVVGTRELASNAFTSTTIGTTTNNLTVDNATIQLNSGTTFNGSAAKTISVKNSGITLAKIANIADDTILGNVSGGAAAPSAISAGDIRTLINVEDGATADQTGAEIATALNTDFGGSKTFGNQTNDTVTFTGPVTARSFTVGAGNAINFSNNTSLNSTSLFVQGVASASQFQAPKFVLDTPGLGGEVTFAQDVGGSVAINYNNGVNTQIGRSAGDTVTIHGMTTFETNVTASGAISASGTITANAFVGDGSGLTGLSSAANGQLTLATSGAINGSATFTANQSGDTTFTVSVDDATTSAKGVASFSSDNFNVSSGAVTIKNGGVALAEMANLAADRILGRANGAGTGAVTGLTATQLRTIINVESGADVTDSTNVTDAGAVMDSEVTNLAFVKGLTGGISDGNVLTANDAVADDDFLRINGTEVEGRSASEVLGDIGAQASLTFGKSSGNALKSEEALATNDVLLMGTSNVKGRTYSQFRGDLGIEAGATADQSADEIAALFQASTNAVTFGGAVTVEGDLIVNGDLTTVNTTNLLVEDKFTTFASGSTSSTDGGIIVQGAASAGQGFGWDSATGRWAFDDDMSLSATGLAPDGYVATVSGSTADANGNPNYGGSSNGYGNIHVNTSTGDIFIYV